MPEENMAQSSMSQASSGGPWKAIGIIFILLFMLSTVVAVWFYMQLSEAQSQIESMESQMMTMQEEMDDEDEEMVKVEDGFGLNTDDLGQRGFDPETIKVGDQVAGMTLAEIDSSRPGDRPNWPRSTSTFVFEGEITLTGNYEFNKDVVLGCELSFSSLTPRSLEGLPAAISDTREPSPWFCFEDEDRAINLLGISEDNERGSATITIDKYEIVLFQSAVWNTARLVSVESRNEDELVASVGGISFLYPSKDIVFTENGFWNKEVYERLLESSNPDNLASETQPFIWVSEIDSDETLEQIAIKEFDLGEASLLKDTDIAQVFTSDQFDYSYETINDLEVLRVKVFEKFPITSFFFRKDGRVYEFGARFTNEASLRRIRNMIMSVE